MLQRIQHDNGVVTYRSPLLAQRGVVHGFTTRIGGVSPGPYATLNLGWMRKDAATDPNAHIAENFRRLRAALGLARTPRVEVRQVHGSGVWVVDGRLRTLEQSPEADALVTARPGRMLTVRTADCVPVLLAGPGGRVVGAAHAGWRGILAGVVGAAAGAVCELAQAAAGELVAAIGPAIGVRWYEVGPEVAEAFVAAGLGAWVRDDLGPRPHVDLPGAAAQRLEEAGVPGVAIDRTDRCTYEHEDEFFSYRRARKQGGPTARNGQMSSVIVARGPAA